MRHSEKRWGPGVFDILRIEVRDDAKDSAVDQESPSSPDSPDSPASPDSTASTPSPTSTTFSTTTTQNTVTSIATISSSTSIAAVESVSLITRISTTTSPSSLFSSTEQTTLSSAQVLPLSSVVSSLLSITSTAASLTTIEPVLQQKSPEPMSDGTKVGIVLGTIFGIAFVISLVFCIFRWRKRRNSIASQNRSGSGLTDETGPAQHRDRSVPNKTESAIIDELMTAAYATDEYPGSHDNGRASIAPSRYIVGIDDYIDEKDQTLYGRFHPYPAVTPSERQHFPENGTVDEFQHRPYSFLQYPSSIATRKEAAATPSEKNELLSLYARSSRGLSWFYKPTNSKARSNSKGEKQPATHNAAPVLDYHEIISEPEAVRTAGGKRVVSMAATAKTSETVSTEKTWNTWAVGGHSSKPKGRVERWMEKNGLK